MSIYSYLATILVVAAVAASNEHDGAADQSSSIELNENNWELMLEGEWMVEFFAPWCPACKNLAPTWDRFADMASSINVKVAKIDVTTSPSLSGRFFVTALPTIYHVNNGEFRQYRGSRDGDAFMYFLKQKQWNKIEPISAWKKPDSLHMSVLSYFFKLSHTLKDFNTRLQEEYGLPTWGSYGLFAIGTIFVGAALGLMLVCIVDFLYPPKKTHRQSFSEAKEKSLNAVEDLATDEIEDDEPQNQEDSEDEEEAADKENEEESSDGENGSGEGFSGNEETELKDEGKTKSNSEPADTDANAKQSAGVTASPSDVRKRKPRKAD